MEGSSNPDTEDLNLYRPLSVQHQRKYDVFVNFRGADVKKTLVEPLFQRLSTAGIRVFREREILDKGKNTGDSLEGAIRNSSVHIPILSVNYASSEWCLDELSLIWRCKSMCTGNTIIPLFYKVEPSDVRYPDKKGPYAEAFQNHRKSGSHSEKKMDSWKEALYQISLLSGWALAETAAGGEQRLVKQVVRDVLTILEINCSPVARKPVELLPHEKEWIKLLNMVANSRGMKELLGVDDDNLGMSLESSLDPNDPFKYLRLISQRHTLYRRRNLVNLIYLQSPDMRDNHYASRNAGFQPMSMLETLSSFSDLRWLQSFQLFSPRSLAELPNLDSVHSLHSLPGNLRNLDVGSMSHVRRLKILYCRILAKLLNLDSMQSLKKLFLYHSEQLKELPALLEDLNVGYCSKLKKVPSMSHMRRLPYYRSLAECPNPDSMHSSNQLFLQRFVYLKEWPALPKSLICLKLPNLRFVHPVSFKFLCYLDIRGTQLHHLSNEVGELLCLEDLDLSECSLWDLPQSFANLINLKVLRMSKNHFRSFPVNFHQLKSLICLDASWNKGFEELPVLPEDLISVKVQYCTNLLKMCSLSHMRDLESLDLSYCRSFAELPELDSIHSLRELALEHCKELKKLPALPEDLISLKVRECHSLHEISSISRLKCLETLNLSHCRNLTDLPDLSSMHSLTELTLDFCDKLEKLPALPEGLVKVSWKESLKQHKLEDRQELKLENCYKLGQLCFLPQNFIHVKVIDCYNLQDLSSISHMLKLETLELSSCSGIIQLPELNCMQSLKKFTLDSCDQLEELPCLPEGLINLKVRGCYELQKISHMSHMKNLETLQLSLCIGVTTLPELDSMQSLRELKMDHCENLEELPSLPKGLINLSLVHCHRLQKISSMSHISKLEVVDFSWCTSLTKLPELQANHFLRDLTLEHCEELEELLSLPKGLCGLNLGSCYKLRKIIIMSEMINLKTLQLPYCRNLTQISHLGLLKYLEELTLEYCENLEELPCLPEGLMNLSLVRCYKLQNITTMSCMRLLKTFHLSSCISLTKLPRLDALYTLRGFKVENCENLEELPSLPVNLINLSLVHCYKLQNISSMCDMRNLETVDLSWCINLCNLPKLNAMHSLRELKIEHCVKLKEFPFLPESVTNLNASRCYKLQKIYMSNMKRLENLYLPYCTSLTELSQLEFLEYLRNLTLDFCEELNELPALPSGLIHLSVRHCYKLERVYSMSHLKNLEYLDLSSCISLTKLPEVHVMYSLSELKIEHWENLEELPSLPEGLINLSLVHCYKLQTISSVSYVRKLETLDLSWCTSLTKLPNFDRMHSLRELILEHCEKLEDLPSLPKDLNPKYY